MHTFPAIAFTLCLFAAQSSQAANDSPFQCNPAGNQQELNACAVRDYQAADKDLNKKYKSVMAGLSPQARERLRIEQRAWVKQRDPQCKAEVKNSEGGSIWPLEYFGCLQGATLKRIDELGAWRDK